MSAKKAAPGGRRSAPSKMPAFVYQLKVTLSDSRPPIWRHLLVSGDTTLDDLHWILQIAMGWNNSHLHQFIKGDRTRRRKGRLTYYSDPAFELDDGFLDVEMLDETRARLDQVVPDVKDKLTYEYDFGDSWEHEIVVEKIFEPSAEMACPQCVAGKRAGPPEDVGGVWGYANLLDALENEDHPDREELLDRVPDDFDPAAFHPEPVNRELKRMFRRR